MAVYSFLVVAFYVFLGLFLGNRTAEITVTTLFSFAVRLEVRHRISGCFFTSKLSSYLFFLKLFFQALSVMFLFIRCTAIDPTDKTSFRKKKRAKSKSGLVKLKFGFIMGQIVVRFLRRVERKILRTFIRRKYLDPWKTSAQMEPLLPFPLVMKDDAISPHLKEDDISFCSLCDFEVS